MGVTKADPIGVSAADLIAQLQDPVLATDLDGVLTAFNHGAEQLFGYPAEAVIGSHCSTLIPDSRLIEFTINLEAVLGGDTRRVDGQARTSHGVTVEVAVTSQPLRAYDGTIAGAIMVLRDMSERMLRERQLLSMSRLLGETERHSDAEERDSWFSRLRRALDEDRFVLHAQPIVPICSAGLPRFELLIRMLDDNDELVLPGAFLLDAERLDLIGEIDRWVISQAVSLLHEHARIGNDFSLSVNLSGKTMNDLDLAGDVGEMLKASPIPPGRLVVEVTETAAIVNIERARELAEQLRRLGCLFALDDFGSGFSSFYYLKHLEFDYLKIDGEFITKLVSTETDQLLVQAVVGIARGLGTQTVAEFVGDSETVKLLEQLGVDYGQGYHLGRPAPVETLLPQLPRKL
jgi:PAS domain S-box-containing protein